MPRPALEQHSLLRQSFVHLPSLGPRTERHLWRIGIRDWEGLFCEASRIFRGKRLSQVLLGLDACFEAFQAGDLDKLAKMFPSAERWRLVAGVSESLAYFDIEADGGGQPPLAQSTAVAFYFEGQVFQEWEKDKKLELLERMLEESALLCTYNGAAYDVPFLAAEYGFRIEKAHIDLCPWLRRQGYRGGLKAIQKSMPHLPQRTAMDIDGYDAVRLWRLHQQGWPKALETLLTYNAEDALILEPLLVDAFNRELERFPELAITPLVSRPQPELSTGIDPGVYSRLKSGLAEIGFTPPYSTARP